MGLNFNIIKTKLNNFFIIRPEDIKLSSPEKEDKMVRYEFFANYVSTLPNTNLYGFPDKVFTWVHAWGKEHNNYHLASLIQEIIIHTENPKVFATEAYDTLLSYSIPQLDAIHFIKTMLNEVIKDIEVTSPLN